jgi:hypothetical protein
LGILQCKEVHSMELPADQEELKVQFPAHQQGSLHLIQKDEEIEKGVSRGGGVSLSVHHFLLGAQHSALEFTSCLLEA